MVCGFTTGMREEMVKDYTTTLERLTTENSEYLKMTGGMILKTWREAQSIRRERNKNNNI
jgi:hypothetical protein